MTLIVPFDGSDLAVAALKRASLLGTAFDLDVHAVTVIPAGSRYAQDKGWIEPTDSFDAQAIAKVLRRQVRDVDADISYHGMHVASRLPQGAIARRIRRKAGDLGADLVVIGSDNAGGIVTPLSSVGSSVATDHDFDVYIVRRPAEYLTSQR